MPIVRFGNRPYSGIITAPRVFDYSTGSRSYSLWVTLSEKDRLLQLSLNLFAYTMERLESWKLQTVTPSDPLVGMTHFLADHSVKVKNRGIENLFQRLFEVYLFLPFIPS